MRIRVSGSTTFLASSCILSSLALILGSGCDSGPKTAHVSGVVTYNGQPVEEGTVSFYPVSGSRPAIGKIQSNGAFELSTFEPGDGALLGEHKVAIEAKKVTSTALEPKSFAEELAQESTPSRSVKSSVTWLVPQKYSSAESSGLTATIVGGNNEVNFALP